MTSRSRSPFSSYREEPASRYPARNFKNAPVALQEYYNRYVNAPGPPLAAAAANKLYNDDDDDNRATLTAAAPR
ncbi:hypothetical protein L249_4987, partial [Ophiocordyceps polyrhachis-furcata BCC 54312]